ncbi:MAG: 50S ribosomal protein L11 methyltransferase [Caldilineaceae bacterium]|nr:50S ribosomal protein L11 methyltransferase [Caldilineaceae bacterium]
MDEARQSAISAEEPVWPRLGRQLPLETVALPVGDRTWQLTCVPSRAGLAADATHLEHDLYGFLLWEAAIGLAHYLTQTRREWPGKHVLELGAGVGLPGLVAHSLGATVRQTDYQPDALALTVWNAHQNGITGLETFLADWRTWRHAPRYDLILGADILYDATLHFYLETIFHKQLRPGGMLLLSDPGRPQALAFAVQLEDHGWQLDLQTVAVTSRHPMPLATSTEITILTAQR